MDIPNSVAITKLIDYNTINNVSVEDLQQLFNELFINENDNLKKTIDKNTCDSVAHKKSTASILSFITEVAKYNWDLQKLNDELNNTRLLKPHVKLLSEMYKTYRNTIRGSLQVIGNSHPHIVDVKWKLEQTSKTSASQTGGLRYSIFLKVIKNNQTSIIKFTCNVQQLQELVLKLKDAMHHLEKLASC